jgi:hypothetical protein
MKMASQMLCALMSHFVASTELKTKQLLHYLNRFCRIFVKKMIQFPFHYAVAKDVMLLAV